MGVTQKRSVIIQGKIRPLNANAGDSPSAPTAALVLRRSFQRSRDEQRGEGEPCNVT